MTERELLAAELALRLLSDDEHAAAAAQLASDPELARFVAEWEARLAPLATDLPPVEPAATTWPQIAASIRAMRAGNDNQADETNALRRRVRLWQWGSAAAAAAALVLGYLGAPLLGRGADQGGMTNPGSAVLVASLPVGSETGPRLGLTYLPQSSDLVVEAGGVAGDGVHDHELWLVVPGAKPVSMGVIAPGRQARLHLSPELAARVAAGLDVVLTREPLGGAPAGGDAGPVVASGKFSSI